MIPVWYVVTLYRHCIIIIIIIIITLRERSGEYRCAIENNIDESVPIHFNQPNHTISGVQSIPLLHINSNRDSILFSMEQHLIDKAGTVQNSINQT